jgi:hypothetical protein
MLCLPFSLRSSHTNLTGFNFCIKSNPTGSSSISFLSLLSDKELMLVTAQLNTATLTLPNTNSLEAPV